MKGDWTPISTLKEAHPELANQKTSILDRLKSMKRWGKNTGDFSVEISGDQVRLLTQSKSVGAMKAQSDEEIKKTESIVDKMIKDFKAKGGDGMSGQESKDLFNKYFKDSGVSDKSKNALYNGIKNWTFSVHSREAQTLRNVAREYYGRTPDQEWTAGAQSYFKEGLPTEMKDAALALKAFAGAYAEKEGPSVLYRGVSGGAAAKIRQALKEDGEVKLPVNSLSSWSSSKKEAKDFAGSKGVLLKLKVDPDNIWASYNTTRWLFSSHLDEKEYIVGHHQAFEKFKKEDVELISYD